MRDGLPYPDGHDLAGESFYVAGCSAEDGHDAAGILSLGQPGTRPFRESPLAAFKTMKHGREEAGIAPRH